MSGIQGLERPHQPLLLPPLRARTSAYRVLSGPMLVSPGQCDERPLAPTCNFVPPAECSPAQGVFRP